MNPAHRKLLLATLIPLFVLSACSDSRSSNTENPVANPTPVDEGPGVETPPADSPTAESPQEPDATPATPNTEVPPPDPAEGELKPADGNPIANSQWRICSGGGPSILYQHTFTTNEYSYIFAYYESADCQGNPDSVTEINGGTYTLGNIITTTDGLEAIELDMFNTRLLDGELGSKAYAQYNIVHVNGDVLYLGHLPEQEISQRPQTLDFDDEYRRNP